MRYTLIARFLLRIAIIFGLPCVAAAENSLTNEQIIINFNTIAFGNEYTKQQYGHVRKWEKPIYVGILGKPPDSFDDMVVHFLDELIAATGHPMPLVYFAALSAESGCQRVSTRTKW